MRAVAGILEHERLLNNLVVLSHEFRGDVDRIGVVYGRMRRRVALEFSGDETIAKKHFACCSLKQRGAAIVRRVSSAALVDKNLMSSQVIPDVTPMFTRPPLARALTSPGVVLRDSKRYAESEKALREAETLRASYELAESVLVPAFRASTVSEGNAQ